MTRVLLILTFFLSLSAISHSQEEKDITESDSYLPLECLDQKIYIEKYEPITSFEIAQAINDRENSSEKDSINGKTQILEGANFFNLILYRKINNQITDLTTATKDTLIEAVHKRDRQENINGNYRYLVLTDFSFTAFDEKSKVNPGYYLFDQENNIKYQTYPTVESVLSAIELARKRRSWGDQERLDAFLEPYNRRDQQRAYKIQREKKPMNIIYLLIIGTIITLASIF